MGSSYFTGSYNDSSRPCKENCIKGTGIGKYIYNVCIRNFCTAAVNCFVYAGILVFDNSSLVQSN